VRLGILLEAAPGGEVLTSLVTQASAAESCGLDLAWASSTPGAETALLAAAAVAARTSTLRLAACMPAGGHPLELGEGAAVVDNISNGRLTLVIADPGHDSDLLAETVEVILAASAPRPFRHAGRRWQIPANLPENDQHEARVVVTPRVVQTELPVWLLGLGAARVAREWALSCVAALDEAPAQAAKAWEEAAELIGRAVARLRRPALRPIAAGGDGGFDHHAVVEQLRGEEVLWGLDTAVLRLPGDLDDRARVAAIQRIATHVRPRLVLDVLPPGLEIHWDAVLG
jgi:alkanesulfonate monooxygenase SsuD/methylene tetrahydromethanopterin reductase-like flavin-dependent oxidoreductase (luciferase family)